jgi:ADP-ribose pyrophosphatase
MAAIEAATGRDVGVMKRDKYWLWVNDACAFPNGKKGVYGRFMWMRSLEGAPGVAVMPILSDGKIVLNCNFRHATRSWEIELPRGVVDHGEDVEAAARRETLEETGMVVESLMLLGEITPDTGVANTIVPVFAANVGEKMVPQQQESEAIEEVLALSMQEIKHAFLQGYYECNVRGIQKKIPFRDPFLAYAIFMHDIKKEK